jgi:hypothetical protein
MAGRGQRGAAARGRSAGGWRLGSRGHYIQRSDTVKRDMDLVRAILLKLEEHPHGRAPDELKIDGHTDEQVGHHVFLMIQANLVKGVDATTFHDSSPMAEPTSLTWEGHEFLANARDDTRWQQAKEVVKQKGGDVSLGVPTQLLTSLAKSALGIP